MDGTALSEGGYHIRSIGLRQRAEIIRDAGITRTAPGVSAISDTAPERLNPDDFGYFDPFEKNKTFDTTPAIQHTGKITFFSGYSCLY